MPKRKIIIFNVTLNETLNLISIMHNVHSHTNKNSISSDDNEITEIAIKIDDKMMNVKEKVGFMGTYVYTTIETEDLQILKDIAKNVYEKILTQSNNDNKLLLVDNIDDFKGSGEELNNDNNYVKTITALSQLIKISQLKFIENFSKLMFVTSLLLFIIYVTEVVILNMDLILTPYPKPSFSSIFHAFGVVLSFAILLIFITKYRKKSERNI